MTGRQEHTIKTENHIEKTLLEQPKILSQYYKSLEEKTAQTKRVYVNYLIEYFNYLKANGFDPSNADNFRFIKKLDIDDYLSSTKYKILKNGERKENGESIRRSKMFAVKKFYDFLVDNDYINSNPCDKVKLPSLSKDIKVVAMSKEEVEKSKRRIINSGDKFWKRNLAIFVIGVRTGLRVTSIIEINIEDIDFVENCIRVTEKGNKQREVYFGEDTKNIITDWIKERGSLETDALFVNGKGERVSYMVPKYIMDRYAPGYTCHKMRSTTATNLYEDTGDIYLVADVLGHKNIANTRRYANISQKKRKQAASMLDNL